LVPRDTLGLLAGLAVLHGLWGKGRQPQIATSGESGGPRKDRRDRGTFLLVPRDTLGLLAGLAVLHGLWGQAEIDGQMKLAMQGIRVLDLTDAVAGPFACMMLARCGAEVIKIESRRHLGFRASPKSADLSHIEAKQLMTPVFARYNLDKLSLTLNLAKPEGKEIFKKLVRISDVVIDNLSFGVMQKWGFDYAALKQLKNDIIVASLPSFGRGPHEEWTTWGMNLLSFTGFAHGWGHAETPMEERAANSTYGDYIAGMMAGSAVLASLWARAKSGEGRYIEVSQTEATASLLSVSYLDYFVNQRVAPTKGNRTTQFAPYNCYPCQGEDRWCVIAVSNEEEWQQLCRALDSPQWAEDPKFQNMESRLKNADELDRKVEEWTRQHTPHQVMKILQSFKVAAGAVQNSEDLYLDPQLRAGGHMLEMDWNSGKITFDRPPVHLAEGEKEGSEGAALLGQHNDYIYRELLGLSPEEIDRLTEEKIIY
jgi:benzylsuccinate CoA-transferase BbsF subunit